MKHYDVIIIGAGAAGLMCAIEAGRRGRSVLVIDHAEKAGNKILISGGGRCNFTNLHAEPAGYICSNSRFVISALSRYTPYDFLALAEKHGIAWEERDHGQLFCVESARQIVTMLLAECRSAEVSLQLNCTIQAVSKNGQFRIETERNIFRADSLVIATGGLSLPKTGATPFGHKIAAQFGLNIIAPTPGLVPFTFTGELSNALKELAGISLDVSVSCRGHSFREAMLFTHRGLSGPAMLQISSCWQPGDELIIDLLPDLDISTWLEQKRGKRPKAQLATVLSEQLPRRLVKMLMQQLPVNLPLQQFTAEQLQQTVALLQGWRLKPNGTEGYRTAEVTVGGVDTNELSSKTMESKKVPGLYFIGEVVDVTGQLGGFNFQWAWASGHAAGEFV
ncbi:MAG: NAD(P)/FAD-dependent oxidoreductase [Mariprofundaceae bacterium]|nr:NAD(P)/FAD-dependent oxidoreductase [Mariprofundaceae bacterium]